VVWGGCLGFTVTTRHRPEQLQGGLGCNLEIILLYLLFLLYTYFLFHFCLVCVCVCMRFFWGVGVHSKFNIFSHSTKAPPGAYYYHPTGLPPRLSFCYPHQQSYTTSYLLATLLLFNFFNLKMKAPQSFQTSETTHPVTQRYIPRT
jgi:hypothetical protein